MAALGPLSRHRLLVEARFPRRLTVLDFIGHFADSLESEFPDVSVLPSALKLENPTTNAEALLAPDRFWVNYRSPNENAVLQVVETALLNLAKILDLQTVDFLGVRQVLLYKVSRVSEATDLFRRAFFDYRKEPPLLFGADPIEAQAIYASKVDGGVCRVSATSIYLQSGDVGIRDIEELVRLDPNPEGALLLDVDRTNDEGIAVWDVPSVAKELLTDGQARALDFMTHLEGRDGAVASGREG